MSRAGLLELVGSDSLRNLDRLSPRQRAAGVWRVTWYEALAPYAVGALSTLGTPTAEELAARENVRDENKLHRLKMKSTPMRRSPKSKASRLAAVYASKLSSTLLRKPSIAAYCTAAKAKL